MTFSPSQLLILGAVLLGALLTFIVTELNVVPFGLPADEKAWLQQTEPGDPALAFVDGWPIRRSSVLNEAVRRGLVDPDTPGPAALAALDGDLVQDLVKDLVDRQMLALEARRRGLDRDRAAVRLLRTDADAVLSDLVLSREVARQVTPQTVRALYDRQVAILKSSDEIRARHILVKTRAEARAVAARLAAGEAFDAVAKEVSIDPGSKDKGGDLGYFMRRDMTPAFSKVAFATKVGAVSKPFRTSFGWHIVKVEDRRKPVVPTFEALKPQLVRYEKFQVIEKLLEELRARSSIDYVLGTGPAL